MCSGILSSNLYNWRFQKLVSAIFPTFDHNTFLTQIYNVTSDVTIYSITNSLVELSNVNKVQISINGNINVTYRENTSLSTVFERNLELVE